MVRYLSSRFAGYDCVKLENAALALWITRSVGPRVIGLSLLGGESLFAVLPDDQAECPGVGTFCFRGGHRLWCAPESFGTTYLPDDDPVHVEEVQDGVLVTQPVQAQTGIRKSLAITLPGSDARVIIDHRLRNTGNDRVVAYSGEGELLFVMGYFGSKPKRFNHPSGIACSDDGYLYVSDTYNNIVKVFKIKYDTANSPK